ncbi:hypothetical protein B0H11DRAFT_1931493 [Mycena galericulata]|nr:hypothetical protein B0H11DRAFT_1931493 [Mycena galericulata]
MPPPFPFTDPRALVRRRTWCTLKRLRQVLASKFASYLQQNTYIGLTSLPRLDIMPPGLQNHPHQLGSARGLYHQPSLTELECELEVLEAPLALSSSSPHRGVELRLTWVLLEVSWLLPPSGLRRDTSDQFILAAGLEAESDHRWSGLGFNQSIRTNSYIRRGVQGPSNTLAKFWPSAVEYEYDTLRIRYGPAGVHGSESQLVSTAAAYRGTNIWLKSRLASSASEFRRGVRRAERRTVAVRSQFAGFQVFKGTLPFQRQNGLATYLPYKSGFEVFDRRSARCRGSSRRECEGKEGGGERGKDRRGRRLGPREREEGTLGMCGFASVWRIDPARGSTSTRREMQAGVRLAREADSARSTWARRRAARSPGGFGSSTSGADEGAPGMHSAVAGSKRSTRGYMVRGVERER